MTTDSADVKPEIDLFKNVEQKIERIEVKRLRSAINPRQAESYAAVKMAGDIAECGFRILNRPICAFPVEEYRQELSLADLERLILQGHRRTAGWIYLGEHFEEFGLTAKQAEMFKFIEVDTLFGLTKEQCLEFALDEKYKVNLKAWEVASLLYKRMCELKLANVNVSELTLNYAKLILESRLVRQGPGKLPKILNIENRRIQNEEFVKAARNGCNQIFYAARLGPWFAEQAVLTCKYVVDGIPEPDDSARVIDAGWSNLTSWCKDYVNAEGVIWTPVEDVIVEGDAKAPRVAKVVPDACEPAREWIEKAIRSHALGGKPKRTVTISKATKEKLDKNMTCELSQMFNQLINKGDDVLPQLAELDDHYRRVEVQIQFLKQNLAKMPKARQPLARTFIEKVSKDDFNKVWLSK